MKTPALVTLDTSVVIAHRMKPSIRGFVLASVVLQELTAGANDATELQWWGNVYQAFDKEGRLLVPTGEDWWQAGRILNLLLRGLKSKSGGKTPKLPASDKQRIIRDVLIARTAKRAGVTVITDNLADFKRIKRYCDVRILSAEQYFKG
jgi:predicted nucleic acid-binding protein